MCPFHGVAPDRVYSGPMLPWGRVSSYLAFPPLPAKPAVSLCCTIPEVAFGGRYPLSLPYGARTFLIDGLSACPRDCLAYSQIILADNAGKVKDMIENSFCLQYNI